MDRRLRPSIFQRFLALVLDAIFLGIIGIVSGLIFEDFYVSLGKYGTLIGSSITIIYFSVFHSKIGQTPGKMTIGAKVTDLNGQYLSIGKSFLRSFIVFFPIMNVEIFSGGNGVVIIVMLILLTVFTSIYFIFVNKSRRCLHDILVSGVVINENVKELELSELNDWSRKKLIPIGIIAFFMIGAGLYQTFTENTFSNLLGLKQKIEERKEVISVNQINSGTTTYIGFSESSKKYSSVNLTVRIDDEKEASNADSQYFDEYYRIIKKELPESLNVDAVVITLYYGYNIGIANKTRSVRKTYN